MKLVALSLVLTLPVGTPDWTLEVNPVVQVEMDMPVNRTGMSLGNVIILNTSVTAHWQRQSVVEEELFHSRQIGALGPGFAVAYALTLGQAFEPYDVFNPGVTPHTFDPGKAWRPDDPTRCPMLRVGSDGTDFMPCWRI